MTRLSTQLQYFVNKKIAEDAEWRGVEIILSGHDVSRSPFPVWSSSFR
jgi:5'-3' exoribonuclease 1